MPPSRTERTQKASPAAIKFHLADTLKVASTNRTKAKTSRIIEITLQAPFLPLPLPQPADRVNPPLLPAHPPRSEYPRPHLPETRPRVAGKNRLEIRLVLREILLLP